MRVGYRIALASLATVVFALFGIGVILTGKEGYVPKVIALAGAFALLPNLLLSRLGFNFPWALRSLEWPLFVLLQFGYCYGLVLLIEVLIKRFGKSKSGSAAG